MRDKEEGERRKKEYRLRMLDNRRVRPPTEKIPSTRAAPRALDTDGTYTADEVEFMNALQAYKERHGRPFPTWSEVLQVLRELGYEKVKK